MYYPSAKLVFFLEFQNKNSIFVNFVFSFLKSAYQHTPTFLWNPVEHRRMSERRKAGMVGRPVRLRPLFPRLVGIGFSRGRRRDEPFAVSRFHPRNANSLTKQRLLSIGPLSSAIRPYSRTLGPFCVGFLWLSQKRCIGPRILRCSCSFLRGGEKM